MDILQLALGIVVPLLVVSLVLAFIRLARGPSLLDRLVALDLMVVVAVGFIAAYAMATGESAYLDVAVVLALLGFLGTVAFATYVERRVE
jgi:multicomponent Na+:H+ antiporter subunit F